MTLSAPGAEGGGEPFGTVYVPFDADGEAFVLEVAKAMQGLRLRTGRTLTAWPDLHPEARQRIADVARVAVAMTRVRYATPPAGSAARAGTAEDT